MQGVCLQTNCISYDYEPKTRGMPGASGRSAIDIWASEREGEREREREREGDLQAPTTQITKWSANLLTSFSAMKEREGVEETLHYSIRLVS